MGKASDGMDFTFPTEPKVFVCMEGGGAVASVGERRCVLLEPSSL